MLIFALYKEDMQYTTSYKHHCTEKWEIKDT